jgi:hypothetical protein
VHRLFAERLAMDQNPIAVMRRLIGNGTVTEYRPICISLLQSEPQRGDAEKREEADHVGDGGDEGA